MRSTTPIVLAALLAASGADAAAGRCDKVCLEQIADQYRAAWRMHDTKLAPFASRVRFVENNVEMPFPDGSWDTVTLEVGVPMVLSDPVTGQVGIYTSALQNDTQTFVAIRLLVVDSRITEVEHVLSTRRNLSSPPTPIGDVWRYLRDPDFHREVPAGQGASRAQLAAHANGYFETLQFNNGEIRGTRFTPEATRNENGLLFTADRAGLSQRALSIQQSRARPRLLSGRRGAQCRDVPRLHRSQGRA